MERELMSKINSLDILVRQERHVGREGDVGEGEVAGADMYVVEGNQDGIPFNHRGRRGHREGED